MIHLSGKLLLATPDVVEDTLFHNSLVYISGHNREGSHGFIINKPSDFRVGELLKTLGETKIPCPKELDEQPVYIGGPVNRTSMYILHVDDNADDGDVLGESQRLQISSSDKMLTALCAGDGPRKYIVLLGCSAWGPGQLEEEFNRNSWIPLDCDDELIFESQAESRAHLAARNLGFNLDMMIGS